MCICTCSYVKSSSGSTLRWTIQYQRSQLMEKPPTMVALLLTSFFLLASSTAALMSTSRRRGLVGVSIHSICGTERVRISLGYVWPEVYGICQIPEPDQVVSILEYAVDCVAWDLGTRLQIRPPVIRYTMTAFHIQFICLF